jgi:hypothetical protein
MESSSAHITTYSPPASILPILADNVDCKPPKRLANGRGLPSRVLTCPLTGAWREEAEEEA